jgi:hypothetical protein
MLSRPQPIMRGAKKFKILHIMRATLSKWPDMFDLQEVSGGTALARLWMTIPALILIAHFHLLNYRTCNIARAPRFDSPLSWRRTAPPLRLRFAFLFRKCLKCSQPYTQSVQALKTYGPQEVQSLQVFSPELHRIQLLIELSDP